MFGNDFSSYISITLTFIFGLAALWVVWQDFTIRRTLLREDHKQKEKELELKREQIEIEKQNRDEADKWINDQAKLLNNIALTISKQVSKELADNAKWAISALKEAKLTPHAQTLFGSRLRHFENEKQFIAQRFADFLLCRCRELISNGKEHVIVFIDSGTTMYYLMNILSEKSVDLHQSKDTILNRITVVTNNLPGVEALIERGRTNPNSRYSPLALNCFLLPGKPLPVYSAVLGDQTNHAIRRIRKQYALIFKEKARKIDEGEKHQDRVDKHVERGPHDGMEDEAAWLEKIAVIGLVTGNWVRLRRTTPPCPIPLARGEGHLEFKQALIDESDEVYVLSPLGKIFCGVDPNQPNIALGYSARSSNPEKEPYEEVNIDNKKAGCVKLVSTSRGDGMLLSHLSTKIKTILGDVKDFDMHVYMCEEPSHVIFNFHNLPKDKNEQIPIEFPHDNTRNISVMRDFFFAKLV